MSHSHRDDHQLADVEPAEAAPVVAAPPQSVVANAEAERRAQARRKADGAVEQTMEHQFTGDFREPGGGTDIEVRRLLGDSGEDADDAGAGTAAAARRGPPAPCFEQVEASASWAASGSLYGVLLSSPTREWTEHRAVAAAALPGRTSSWRR